MIFWTLNTFTGLPSQSLKWHLINQLLKQLKSIKPTKASGSNLIAPHDLHLIGNAAADGLYIVCRRSLTISSVPSQWKVSRMFTTHKKRNQSERGNYRPLQMLSYHSKLLEGVVYEVVDNFTTDMGHLTDNQWGVRQGRSTEGHLIYLTGTWKKALDNRQVVGTVYTDFQKVFDTVSHEILMYKLQGMV